VPVEALNLVIPDIAQARAVLAGKNVPLHIFPLARTDLGGGVLGFNGVALLDRPASMLKENLRDYRRLGLYVDSRIALRPLLGARQCRRQHRPIDEAADREPAPGGPGVTGAACQVYAARPSL
jgi:hypothetical protein